MDTEFNRDKEIRNLAKELNRLNNLKELELRMYFGMDEETFNRKLKECHITLY